MTADVVCADCGERLTAVSITVTAAPGTIRVTWDLTRTGYCEHVSLDALADEIAAAVAQQPSRVRLV
jgi:hypothetical protein